MLDRNRGSPEVLLHTLQCAIETGALAIELINKEGARKFIPGCKFPGFLSLDFDAGNSVNDNDRGVVGNQRGVGIVDKNVVAGSVEEIDLIFLPFQGGD